MAQTMDLENRPEWDTRCWWVQILPGIGFIALSIWFYLTPFESYVAFSIFFSFTLFVTGIFEVIGELALVYTVSFAFFLYGPVQANPGDTII